MQENKLIWCLKQKNGIKIIEPNNNLSLSHIKEADETLIEMLKLSGKWKVITAYYSCYNALNSILIKSGIKSEIHSCSIELMSFFDFDLEDITFIENLKDDRIGAQYYLKEKKLEDVNLVKKFILRCKIIRDQLNTDKINKIREKINLELK